METIWKFDIPIRGSVIVPMPMGARVLSVHMQEPGHGLGIQVWAIVDPRLSNPTEYESRKFQVRGTGNPLGKVGKFVGTVFDGDFVWHVFEGG